MNPTRLKDLELTNTNIQQHQCPSYTQNPNANTDAWINASKRVVEEENAKRRVLEERDRIARGVMEKEIERESGGGRWG